MSGTVHRRRSLWLALAAAVLGVLVVVAPSGPEQQEPAAVARASPSPTLTAAPEYLTGPPRGSLASDPAVVEAMRRLPWTDEEPTGSGPIDPAVSAPALGLRSVVFVGDVPGGRWALVVGRVLGPPEAPGSPADGPAGQSGLVAVWFGGPPGSPPERLARLTTPARIAPDWPLGLFDQRTGALVVVAAPGDDIEVSERPLVDEDGGIYRLFRTITTTDGIGTATLRPSDLPVSAAAVYRVLRDGETVARGAPWTVGGRPADELPVAIEYPRGEPSSTGALAVTRAATGVLAQLGLARHEIQVTALWAGNLPGPGPETGQAAVVAVTLPSGAVVVDGEWLLPVDSPSGGYLQGGDCGLGVLPAGPPVEDRVHVLSCEVVEPAHSLVRTVLLVVAPDDVVLVRLYDNDSHYLAELPTVDGIVVAPFPRGTATAEAVSAEGVNLGRTVLLGRGVDFLG